MAQADAGLSEGATPATTGEAAALSLLESFARVEENPQCLVDACTEWARVGAGSARNPSFDYLLGRILRTRTEPRALPEAPDRAVGLSMAIDASGAVTEIDDALSRLVGIGAGDCVADCFAEPLTSLAGRDGPADGGAFITEFADRRGGRHLIEVAAVASDKSGRPRFAARLLKLRLAPAAEDYVRRVFGLTSAEADVLSLVLQRFDVGEIAELRSNRVNTIRTHINSIIRKFGCHSLNAVITSAFEIAYFLDAPRARRMPAAFAGEGRAEERLPGGARVVYSQGGDADGRPLVLLHSLEYGHDPTGRFLEAARARGFKVIAPLRPGFGGTTFAPGAEGTEILAGFLDALGIDDAILVGLSTGAPAAIALGARSPRVGPLVLVNYAFNAGGKLKGVKPRWLAGLVDLVVRSPETARFTAGAGRRLIKALGPERFFKTLYEGNSEDLEFLAANPTIVARSGAVLLGAADDAAVEDLVAAFAPNPAIEAALHARSDVLAVRGSNTHHASQAPMRAEAERFGARWAQIENSGRNCVFQRPDAFLDLMAAFAPAGIRSSGADPARAQG